MAKEEFSLELPQSKVDSFELDQKVTVSFPATVKQQAAKGTMEPFMEGEEVIKIPASIVVQFEMGKVKIEARENVFSELSRDEDEGD